MAYRDLHNDRWNALIRYDFRRNASTLPDNLIQGAGTGSEDHTFAIEAINSPNWRWEFYGKYAIRQSHTALAQDYVSSNTIHLAQLRAVYRFGYKWDMAMEARRTTQTGVRYSDKALSIEGGYFLTPNLRLALGYSFGNVKDMEFTGSRSSSGIYVGATFKVNELMRGFGRQKPSAAVTEEARQQLKEQLTKSKGGKGYRKGNEKDSSLLPSFRRQGNQINDINEMAGPKPNINFNDY